METFLTFIRDWLPSIAVIAGGLWVLFQWIVGEKLRRQKEMPALNGKLSGRVVRYDDSRFIVSIEATWNNCSPLPLSLDIPKCRIVVFRITGNVRNQNCKLVTTQDLGDAVCSHHFLVGQCEVDYVLEPNTESLIINHFVLEPGLYAIRMELYSLTVGGRWWKEMILDARRPEAE